VDECQPLDDGNSLSTNVSLAAQAYMGALERSTAVRLPPPTLMPPASQMASASSVSRASSSGSSGGHIFLAEGTPALAPDGKAYQSFPFQLKLSYFVHETTGFSRLVRETSD
jgi:hypothetical protein